MKRAVAGAVCALALGLLPATVDAQVSIAPKIGTLGLGADIGFGLNRNVVLRGGLGFIPLEMEQEESDIEWTVQFPSTGTVGVDLHPTGGAFRISVGAFFQTKNLELEGIVPSEIEIGDQTYTNDQVSSLNGVLESKAVAPFATLGFGHHGSSGVGLFFELGAAYLGDPDVTLSAEGPATSTSQFQAELAREEAQLEDDFGAYARWYPIVELGIRVGF